MRDLRFRFWNTDYQTPIFEFFDFKDLGAIERAQGKIVQQFAGLYDINGNPIYEGDRLHFFNCPAARCDFQSEWAGDVTFEDGVFTIDILTVKQIKNPEGWSKPYDWIKSRDWACQVGYGEYGDWNVPRVALTKIQTGFGGSIEHFEKYYKPIAEKIGYKKFINARIIGNIFENGELLK